MWDAIGVVSYGLVFAMVETLVVFLFSILAGFLIPLRWDRNRRIALLSTLVLILSLYAIFSQLYFILGWSLPPAVVNYAVSSGHPVRILYLFLLIVTIPLIALPAYAILRSEKAYTAMMDLMDRLSLLTMVYIALDVFAVGVIILRNI